MADAPDPITSPPAQSYQPYDATESGTQDSAPGSERSYAGTPIGRGWVKIKDGGAASPSGGISGGWPDDGTSDGSAWKQC